MGPKLDVILVRLLGDKVQQTGVVAGMSGSPVYFDGKLAGALSLKLGTFTKEAIGGVTPIEDMLEVEKSRPAFRHPDARPTPEPGIPRNAPQTFAAAGVGSTATPCPHRDAADHDRVYPETLAQFGKIFSRGA